jgi:hypothetical protein
VLPAFNRTAELVAGYGRILYFDPDPQTAKPTIVGLHLAGYDVSPAVDLDGVRHALAAVEIGSQPLLAVVIDACSDPRQAESVLVVVKSCIVELPLIVLTHRDRPHPFAASDDVPCLRRPFAPPLLVRLLHHLVGDPTDSPTPVPVRTEPDGAVETHDGFETVIVDSSPVRRDDLAPRVRGSATRWILVGVAALAIGGAALAFALSQPGQDGRADEGGAADVDRDRSPAESATQLSASAIDAPEQPSPSPTVATGSDSAPASALPPAPPPADAAPSVAVEDAPAATPARPRADRRRKSTSSKRNRRDSDPAPAKRSELAAKPAPSSASKSGVEANPYK